MYLLIIIVFFVCEVILYYSIITFQLSKIKLIERATLYAFHVDYLLNLHENLLFQ